MDKLAIAYESLEIGALHLPREDRTKLASRLLKSLDDDDFQLSSEWVEELDRRSKAIDNGTEEMMPSEDFWKEVNQRFGTSFQ
jgi:putative addiction module component (TIGR02574 family)